MFRYKVTVFYTNIKNNLSSGTAPICMYISLGSDGGGS